MAVRADDEGAGTDETELGKESVLHPRAPDIVEVFYALFARKVADDLALLGGFDVLGGHEVVEDEDDLFGIFHPVARLLHLGDRHRRGDVVAEDEVDVGGDELARGDALSARVSCEYLLSCGHFHRRLTRCVLCPSAYTQSCR